MKKKATFISLFLFLLGVATRIPFLEKMQSHWDGPQYSIAIVRYSLSQHTPAPPGYPLYIFLGRVIYQFVHDPHKALLLLSAIFSGISTAAFYLIGSSMFNKQVGLISSILYLSGTTFYFFGITAYAYGAIPVISAILAFIVYQIARKKKKHSIWLGAWFAFAIGFRPQEALLLSPLFLYGFLLLPPAQKLKTCFAFLICFLIWFVPFMFLVGGITTYASQLAGFLKQGALPQPTLFNAKRFFALIQGIYFSFGAGSIFLLYLLIYFWRRQGKNIFSFSRNKTIIFFLVWMLPSFIFNLFIRSDHAGYQGTYLSALLFIIAYSIRLYIRKSTTLFYFAMSIIVAANLFIFFKDYDPEFRKPYRQSSFHYSEIRKNDQRLSAKVAYVKNNFDPKTTVIITEPFPWRLLMYYLPEFLIYDIDGLFTSDDNLKTIVRVAKEWNYREYKSKQLLFRVPAGIQNIVFTDNDMFEKIRDKKRVIYLTGNSNITIMRVRAGDEFSYSSHSFESVN